MPFDKAATNAVEHLTSDATLDELRSAALDLRALSPDSALAELVEEKIERILNEELNISGKGAASPMPQQETGSR